MQGGEEILLKMRLRFFFFSSESIKVLIKWLNLPLPINLNLWDKWLFNKIINVSKIESIIRIERIATVGNPIVDL